MRVSGMQPKAAFKQYSGIHAGQDGEVSARPHSKIAQIKVPDKFFVGF
jgi:hypothetical protein